MTTYAMILAGGGGSRFGAAIPKQFVEVLGKPLLAYTLAAFENASAVNAVMIVCHQEWLEFTKALVAKEGFAKVINVIEGGDTRQASTWAGVCALQRAATRPTKVLVHDGARPLITTAVINEAVERLDETGVVDVCAKTTDTIVKSVGGKISDIPERAALYNGQTPQGFSFEILVKSHEAATKDGITNATDDVQLALRLGHVPVIVDGGTQNMKVTNPDDLAIVQLFLERKLGRRRVVRLTSPYQFREVELSEAPSDLFATVKPKLAAICAADLRYYAGNRRPEVLAKKLPMALLHEGIGVVVFSPFASLLTGDRVVIVPNMERCGDDECRACNDPAIGANYCLNNGFMSSGEDGMTQSTIQMPMRNLVPIPSEVPDEVAVMAELVSITVSAFRRITVADDAAVCVVGAGPVGLAGSFVLSEILQRDVALVRKGEAVPAADVYFEAVGGPASEVAINDIVAAANPGAQIVLLGVAEQPVPINTRDILQKGLRLVGCSRSTTEDFRVTMSYLSRTSMIRKVLSLIAPKRFGVEDLSDAFDYALGNKRGGKVLVELERLSVGA